ncbi:DJ-1/PfpI family protein [Streptococcus merionis]|uniref:Lin0465 protein n=1 Tax=Streptococcus merionis TaxID=400065 RepID=A0A239T084_9STRE|nr:DJ-1/PfpI family protein [Streptococcus merionis]SNU90892.1 lin0465 protein [Streptococcus merionis]
MKTVYMYVQDTMADWEHGYLMQALSLQAMLKKFKVSFKTVGRTKAPIRTASGITLVPDLSLDELDVTTVAALVLIGGDTWLAKEQADVLTLASKLLQQDALVAAICGATLGLANLGLLDGCPHTSNASFFLSQMSQRYRGQDYYQETVAVRDGQLITASSAGSLLWAKYIIEALELYSEKTVEAWFKYFSTGDAAYYGELMASLSQESR